ncbi:hypothetical protein CesoFtcFv8_012477 [Champsocephalus esox]|uniref:Uncharacterized protein n=1 Tax=Champsocephalus esox TaxID=159716 RepID=A0AAN8GV70_9TELE|nr:hypothetical protein CesoFtcFv8_012477 [Champsocephalus esox]
MGALTETRVESSASMPLPSSPYRMEDKNKNQGLVPTGRTERTEDLMKGKFFQGAADNLPSNLPTTGTQY